MVYHKITPIYFPFPSKKRRRIFTVSWGKKPHGTRQLAEALTPKAGGHGKLPSFQQSSPQSQSTSLEPGWTLRGRSEWPPLPSCLGQDDPRRGHTLLSITQTHLQGSRGGWEGERMKSPGCKALFFSRFHTQNTQSGPHSLCCLKVGGGKQNRAGEPALWQWRPSWIFKGSTLRGGVKNQSA